MMGDPREVLFIGEQETLFVYVLCGKGKDHVHPI